MNHYDALYHIYVNEECIHASLTEDEFKREYGYIEAFLSLTGLDKSATIDYERCEPPTYREASY